MQAEMFNISTINKNIKFYKHAINSRIDFWRLTVKEHYRDDDIMDTIISECELYENKLNELYKYINRFIYNDKQRDINRVLKLYKIVKHAYENDD